MEPCSNPRAGQGWGYLALQVHHGLLEGLRWSPLVVAQNGNCSVGTVIGKDLRRNVVIRCKGQERGEQVGPPGLCSPGQGPTDSSSRVTAALTFPSEHCPDDSCRSLSTPAQDPTPLGAVSLLATKTAFALNYTHAKSTGEPDHTAQLLGSTDPMRPLGETGKAQLCFTEGL